MGPGSERDGGREVERDGERQASKAKRKQSKSSEPKVKTQRLIQSCHVIKHRRNIEAKNNNPTKATNNQKKKRNRKYWKFAYFFEAKTASHRGRQEI